MTIDPITYMSQQISAKRAAAIAAGKTVVTNGTTTKKPAAQTPTKTPELYNGPRVTSTILTSREKYLKSIDSSLIKEAAQTLGLNVKFGINPKENDWKARNPELVAEWDKIQQIMADLKASKAATSQIQTAIDAPSVAGEAPLADPVS